MRGDDRKPDALFSYIRPEQRVPADHPLRPIRDMVDTVLRELSPEFGRLYSTIGRPSIPPEKLLRAMVLQASYSIRSERLLVERLEYDLLFPLVRRHRRGRCSLGPFGVLEEPRPAAGRRHCDEVPERRPGTA